MNKKILFLTMLIFSSLIYSVIRVEEYENVRYSYDSLMETLTVSPIDRSREAKIVKSIFNKELGFPKSQYSVVIQDGVKLPDDSQYLFYDLKSVSIPSNINTSNVTNMSSMFERYHGDMPDISNWDVSQVTDMSEMFEDYKGNIPDLSRWDVYNVTNMSRMFAYISEKTPNVSRWNLNPNVTFFGL